jgi:glutamine synthetase
MPKPIEGAPGLHTSVAVEGDVNAFHDPGDQYGLSTVGKHFIAGLLHHAREITAVTNQTVNSYKRLIVGYERRCTCLGPQQPVALVRVPSQARKESSTASSTRLDRRATPIWRSR